MRAAIFFGLILLSVILAPVLIVALVLVSGFVFKAPYARKVFLSLDQLLNVVLGPVFNTLWKPAHKFGDPDETMSSVLGRNLKAGDKRFEGIDNILSRVDPAEGSHSINAIEE